MRKRTLKICVAVYFSFMCIVVAGCHITHESATAVDVRLSGREVVLALDVFTYVEDFPESTGHIEGKRRYKITYILPTSDSAGANVEPVDISCMSDEGSVTDWVLMREYREERGDRFAYSFYVLGERLHLEGCSKRNGEWYQFYIKSLMGPPNQEKSVMAVTGDSGEEIAVLWMDRRYRVDGERAYPTFAAWDSSRPVIMVWSDLMENIYDRVNRDDAFELVLWNYENMSTEKRRLHVDLRRIRSVNCIHSSAGD